MINYDNYKTYSIIFFRRRKVIGIRNVTCTYEQAKDVSNFLQNESKEYKANSGRYTKVGFIETKPLTLREN